MTKNQNFYKKITLKTFDYKSLLGKVYTLINSNDYTYEYMDDLYFYVKDLNYLTNAQKQYILNKASSFISYWYNHKLRCPRQWKKLNNDIKCSYKSLILMQSNLLHIKDANERLYYKKYFKQTLRHNRKQLGESLYRKLNDC